MEDPVAVNQPIAVAVAPALTLEQLGPDVGIPPQQLGPKYQRCWYIDPALRTQFVAWTEVQVMRVSVQSDGVKLNLPSRKVLRVLQLMFPDSAAGDTKVEPVKSLAVLHMLTLVEEEGAGVPGAGVEYVYLRRLVTGGVGAGVGVAVKPWRRAQIGAESLRVEPVLWVLNQTA